MPSANRKKIKILEEFFMLLIHSRNSIGPSILPCGTPHVMNFCSERNCLLFQFAWGLLNKIQTNFWQFPLYHNSVVLIAIFFGQQYPKTHYRHSSLYQVHLQFLCIGQILLEWLICFLEAKLVFVNNVVFIMEI